MEFDAFMQDFHLLECTVRPFDSDAASGKEDADSCSIRPSPSTSSMLNNVSTCHICSEPGKGEG